MEVKKTSYLFDIVGKGNPGDVISVKVADIAELIQQVRDEPRTIYYMSLEEAAAFLNVCYRTVYNWVKCGHLKAKQVGKKWVVEETDVLSLSRIDWHDKVMTF